jgi:DNA repair exonuclease SbcCD ATPase subunit
LSKYEKDQNRYINAYLDTLVGQIHEYTINSLQLKTQLKLANELISEKDQLISQLQNQLDNVQNNDSDVQKAKDQVKHWEDSYHGMTAKVAHMETLLNQIKDMKAVVLEKDKIIETLSKNIEDLQTPKKVINIKPKKQVEQPEKNATDNF